MTNPKTHKTGAILFCTYHFNVNPNKTAYLGQRRHHIQSNAKLKLGVSKKEYPDESLEGLGIYSLVRRRPAYTSFAAPTPPTPSPIIFDPSTAVSVCVCVCVCVCVVICYFISAYYYVYVVNRGRVN